MRTSYIVFWTMTMKNGAVKTGQKKYWRRGRNASRKYYDLMSNPKVDHAARITQYSEYGLITAESVDIFRKHGVDAHFYTGNMAYLNTDKNLPTRIIGE